MKNKENGAHMKKLAIVIGIFAFLAFIGTARADVAWCDSAYSKRIPIYITNTGEFQPQIVLNSSVLDVSELQADGSDIKFCTNDSIRLNHYLEYDTINTSGNSYIRVDVSNNSTIWMYYKNNTAVTSYSDPESISPAGIGDNFSAPSANTSKWTDIPAWGTLWGQEGGFLILNASSSSSAAVYSNAQLQSPNVTVKWAFNVTINPSNRAWEMNIRNNDGTYTQAYSIRTDVGGALYLMKLQSGWQNLGTINASATTSQVGTAYIKQIGDKLTACVNTTATQSCASATDSTYTSGDGINMYKYVVTAGDDILKIDWVYAVNESDTLSYVFGNPEESWRNRRAIILNDTTNKINEPVRMNFTGLTFSDINEIAIFDNHGNEVPQVDVVSYQNGTGNAWADIKFIVNYNTSESSHNYWIYYNFPSAPDKNFTTKIFFDNFTYNNSNDWFVYELTCPAGSPCNTTQWLNSTSYAGIENGMAWIKARASYPDGYYIDLLLDTNESDGFLTVTSINSSGDTPSLIGRGHYDDSATINYALQHAWDDYMYLYKQRNFIGAGGDVLLNSTSSIYSDGEKMGFSIFSSNLTGYVNGTSYITATDTQNTYGGWWGMQSYGSPSVQLWYDNFCFIHYPDDESFYCTTYDTSITAMEGEEQSLPVSLSVSLHSPLHNNITNATTATITFNCSASSNSNLTNITLYGNWSGWHANETQNVSGNFSYATFSKELPQGTYIWNCQACDDIFGCVFAESNYTFIIEPYKIPSINIISPVGFYNNWNNTDRTFNNTWSVPLVFTNDTNLFQVYYSIDGGANISSSNGSLISLDVMKHNITVCGRNIIGEWGCDTDYFEVNGGAGFPKILFNYTIPLDRGTIFVSTLDSFDWDNDGEKEIAIGTSGNDASVWVLDNCSSPSCTQDYLPPRLVAYTKTSGGIQSDRWVWMIDTGDMGGNDGTLNEFCVGTGGVSPTYIRCYKWNGIWYEENYTLTLGYPAADIEALHFCNVDNDSKAELIGARYGSDGTGGFIPIHNYTDTTPTVIDSCRPASALSCQDIDDDGVDESIIGCENGNLQYLDWNGTAYKVYNLANSPCSGFNSVIFQRDIWNKCDFDNDGVKDLMMFCAGGPFSNYTRFNATSLIDTHDTVPYIIDWGGQIADSRYPNECSVATSYGNRSIYRNVSSNEVIFKGRPTEGNMMWFFHLWSDVDNDGYSEVAEVQYVATEVQGNRTIMMLDFSPEVVPLNISWNTPANNSFTNNQSFILWNVTISETPSECILQINGTANYSMLISGNYCYYTTASLANQTTYCGVVYANDTSGNMNMSSMQCATINLTEYTPPAPPSGYQASATRAILGLIPLFWILIITIGSFFMMIVTESISAANIIKALILILLSTTFVVVMVGII